MNKNIIKFILPVFVLISLLSCQDEELVTYSDGGTQKITDAFLQIATPVVSFQAGIPKYEMNLDIINGVKAVTKVKIYSVFTDAKSGKKSAEILFKSIDVPPGAKTSLNQSFNYADLKNGVIVNGAALPTNEADLAVGSGWKFRFEGESALGTVPLTGSVNVAVLSRFAGIYEIVEAKYFRIGVQNTTQPDYFPGARRFIGSVDENTFSYNDFWGSFAWTGSAFRFKVDFTSNKITVPILVNGALFSGSRAISCDTDASIFTNVPCSTSNILIKDDATGKHRIRLTYGYFTDGSGPREFYEELVKVVNN